MATLQRRNDGIYKTIDGIVHKRCTGPAHDEPVYLPATEKYFYTRKSNQAKYGIFVSRCRLCSCWARVNSPGLDHGFIEVHEVIHFYVEVVNRIGLAELANRTGLSYKALSRVLYGRNKYVRKANVRKVMLELISVRRKNEYSIHKRASAWLVQRANGNSAVCVGCGGSLNNYTAGCISCSERKSTRKSRA